MLSSPLLWPYSHDLDICWCYHHLCCDLTVMTLTSVDAIITFAVTIQSWPWHLLMLSSPLLWPYSHDLDICWCYHHLCCDHTVMTLTSVDAIITFAVTIQSWPWHLLMLSSPLLWPYSHDLDICWCYHHLCCDLTVMTLTSVDAIITFAVTIQSWPWHLLMLSSPLLWPYSHDLDICWCYHHLCCDLAPWPLLMLWWPLLWPCSHDLALRLQEEENRAAREHQQRAAARQAQQPRPAAQPRKKSSDVSDVSACQVP